MLFTLGNVPSPGDSVSSGGYLFTVVEMRGPKIEKVKVSGVDGEPGPRHHG
jgi:CBS domain containing-hemolysin-like protein